MSQGGACGRGSRHRRAIHAQGLHKRGHGIFMGVKATIVDCQRTTPGDQGACGQRRVGPRVVLHGDGLRLEALALLAEKLIQEKGGWSTFHPLPIGPGTPQLLWAVGAHYSPRWKFLRPAIQGRWICRIFVPGGRRRP